MSGTPYIAVVTTLASRAEAQAMGRALVEQRLVACAQISAIESIYVWDGALQQEPEFRLLCKTTAQRWPAVEAAIRTLHPYQVPAIHACDLQQVHAAYSEWIAHNVSSTPD